MDIDLSSRGLQELPPGELAARAGGDASALARVSKLNMSHNSLATVSGLQGLTHLTVLDLSYNGLTHLDGGLPLSLISLDVSHNNLSSLKSGALLPLRSLSVLNIAYNRLIDLQGVCAGASTTALRLLHASDNQLSSLHGVEGCVCLEELYVERNLLREAADVAPVRTLPRLRALLLKDNPVLLRKRQVQALAHLLPASLEVVDAPSPSAVTSVNTSTVSASTVATAAEGEGLHQQPRRKHMDESVGAHSGWGGARRVPVPAAGAAKVGREGHPTVHELARPTTTAPLLGCTPMAHTKADTHDTTPRSGGGPAQILSGSGADGVGGRETSPTCPRRQLPECPPAAIPRLQPYDVRPAPANDESSSRPPPERTGEKRGEEERPRAAEARMLRSALLERVVGGGEGGLVVAAPQGGRPPTPAEALAGALVSHSQHRRAHTGEGDLRQALKDAMEERDAYRRRVESLTAELDAVRHAMLLERENTAVVLCINEQLQQRLQALTGVRGAEEGVSRAAARSPQRRPPTLQQTQSTPPPAPPQQQQQQQQRKPLAAAAGAQAMPPLAPPWGAVKTPKDVVPGTPTRSVGATALSVSHIPHESVTETIEMDMSEESFMGPRLNGRPHRADPSSLTQAAMVRQKAASLMAKLRPAATAAVAGVTPRS